MNESDVVTVQDAKNPGVKEGSQQGACAYILSNDKKSIIAALSNNTMSGFETAKRTMIDNFIIDEGLILAPVGALILTVRFMAGFLFGAWPINISVSEL